MKQTLILCLTLLCMTTQLMAKERNITLKVIETSDVHGCFFPYDYINKRPMKGSAARIATYVNALRKEYGDNVTLLDNGDILQGQPISYFSNFVDTASANIAAQVVNYLHYDAQTMGNHDVETGHDVYDKWIREVQCPMLGANIIDNKTNRPYVKPYVLLDKGGAKVAVLGMLTPAIPNWLKEPVWSGMHFEEMVSCARYWVEFLQREEHPDAIIGLFHSGWDGGIRTDEYLEDATKSVSEQVPGFDLILYGHDHTPRVEPSDSKRHTPLCLDPSNNAQYVAEATIELTIKRGKVTNKKVTGKLVDVRNLPVDEAYMAHFQPQIDKMQTWAERKIGSFKQDIYTRDCYFGSSAFNDFILNLQLQITGADISFNAPLSFDASIKAGTVTVADMFKLYKYENQLYIMRLTGSEIRKHLEMSYNLWANTMCSPDDHLLLLNEQTNNDSQRMGFKNFLFNFDSAAGIDYEVDVTKPEGEKVRILRMSNGEPFDENKWYRVAVNSYRGNGGGELLTRGAGIPHDSLASRIEWESDRDQRWYLMQEIERLGILDPQPNNNWRFVPEEWTKPAAERDRRILFGE